MSLPTLTPEQREQALVKAAEARRERKAALDELAAGNVTLADALSGEDPRLHRVKVHRILTALPGVGKVTADKVIAELRIDPGRRVKGLGDRQRKALAEHFAAA
jgi:transposase